MWARKNTLDADVWSLDVINHGDFEYVKIHENFQIFHRVTWTENCSKMENLKVA